MGWQVAGGASYTDAYDVKGDATLTARWERKTLTITIMLGYDDKSVALRRNKHVGIVLFYLFRNVLGAMLCQFDVAVKVEKANIVGVRR